MIIFPAIDIQQGRVVRLIQGKFDRVSEYSQSPIEIARQWISQGAAWLHLVDLDGAKLGKIQNYDTITEIIDAIPVPVQIGGGIRTKDDIENYIKAGASRVILGTRIIEDRNFLKEILAKWGDKIAIALDCSNGMVAQRGWTATTERKAVDFAQEMEKAGVSTLIYTDIKRDGMLTGPDFEGLAAILKAVKISVIVSGGIASLEDIQKLKALKAPNLLGAITGKALYEGRIDLKKALELCSLNG